MSQRKPQKTAWFAVRCVFHTVAAEENEDRPVESWPPSFEERITLWRAQSLDEAITLAEREAREYASLLTDEEHLCRYAGLAQAYHLAGKPGHGTEIYSLIRDSEMEPDAYLDKFFDTGWERQQG